jgi:hypothetical protein
MKIRPGRSEGLRLLGQPRGHLEALDLTSQALQDRPPVAGFLGLVGFDDRLEDAAAALSQLGAQGVLVIAAEVLDDLLDVDREIEGGPVDR